MVVVVCDAAGACALRSCCCDMVVVAGVLFFQWGDSSGDFSSSDVLDRDRSSCLLDAGKVEKRRMAETSLVFIGGKEKRLFV